MKHNLLKSVETEFSASQKDTLAVCNKAAEKLSDLQAYLMMAREHTDLPKDFEFIEYLLTMTHLAVRQVSATTILDSDNRKVS